ncbi:MAG: UDP-N-acetylglucosamine 2-epimerase (non-hydrolyzing) [Deltaproteobacteria bacterium]|nr:UDP-N-acetylglucosamine 2-epimerase (non-hydrolyzing) [Deltaproteobacteria bacterium]
MKKILIVFGTRPEAIKMAPLIKEFEKNRNEFDTKICVTAQHRQMLDQILTLFNIKPDYDFNIMKPKQNLYDITASILLKMKKVLNEFKPDLVLVHGDTTTTFAAALSAYYQKIDVGHIEAGLRTGNIYSPYPEEINRQLASKIAKYHFAPTAADKKNLLKENIKKENIAVTGNTVIDALLMIVKRFKTDDKLKKATAKKIADIGYPELDINRFILATGHRRESFGEGFLNICEGLKKTAKKYPNIDIVYPVHLNPNVKKPVEKILSGIQNIYLLKPINYQSFVYLMSRSYIILTDSGGIQEEAPSLKKPTLVIRDITERHQAIKAGTAKLIGTDKDNIFKQISLLIEDKNEYNNMIKRKNPYGSGHAAFKIVDFIKNKLK